MPFARLTVRSRLYLMLAFVNALLLLSLGYGWHTLHQSDEQLRAAISLKEEFAFAANDIHRAEVEFKMELLHLKNLLLRGRDPELLRRHADGNAESGRKVDAALASALSRSAPLGIPTAPISTLIDNHRELVKTYGTAIESYRAGRGVDEIEKAMRGSFFATSEQLDNLGKLFDAQAERIGREIAVKSQEHSRRRELGLLAVALAAMLASAFAVSAITGGIVRRLRHAVTVAKMVASGDLTSSVESGGGDELGELLEALREMTGSLGGMVRRIRADADGVEAGASQIAAGNRELSSRTEAQASSLEETVASIEEMAANVTRNAQRSRTASQDASGAAEIARRGGDAVRDVVATMDLIQLSSRRIAEILGVIDAIAFQTNILALNAAVEAARAGEQGRGFAVVAAEVRALAQRSAAAAKEIRELVAETLDVVDSGAHVAQDAGRTLAEMVGSVERIAALLEEVATATHEQSAGIAQVNQAATRLEAATQQNAALVEESSAASDSLTRLAHRMAQGVATFKTDA